MENLKQNRLPKMIVNIGNNYFLLGRRRYDNAMCWLKDFEYDNGLWNGGYIDILDSGLNIREHLHFNLFLEPNYFRSYFRETPLNDKEILRLCDLMMQFYNLRISVAVFQNIGYLSERTEREIRKDLADAINKHIEEVIISEIRKLLKPNSEDEI